MHSLRGWMRCWYTDICEYAFYQLHTLPIGWYFRHQPHCRFQHTVYTAVFTGINYLDNGLQPTPPYTLGYPWTLSTLAPIKQYASCSLQRRGSWLLQLLAYPRESETFTDSSLLFANDRTRTCYCHICLWRHIARLSSGVLPVTLTLAYRHLRWGYAYIY